LIPEKDRDILQSSTYGTGLMIRHAANQKNVERILIGIGGSATNDGGVGMADALGVLLLDSEEDPLSPCPAGLEKLALIDRDQLVDLPAIDVACDVDNPVLGPNGATAIFGPQKGANKIETEYLTEVELTFEIKVGTRIWTALVNSAESDTPRTFVTRASSFQGTERVEMLISSEDNGTFFNFPLRTSARNTLIDLNFTSITNSFLTSGISAASIQPSEITHALGIIQTGSTDHQLTFSITPSTIEVLNEADESVRPTAPKISSEINGDSISLSWLSDRRFRYRIEGTSNLSADQWVTVETRNGTSTQIFRSYPLANHFQFYRVVAIER
ncbi:glycerate kinase, partial [Akkermansiaceae bacterium]|nr:glycerate kinase [Akkermansiaceae bacterium]